MKKPYRHLSFADRTTIGVLRERDESYRSIAAAIGFHHSAVGNELNRYAKHYPGRRYEPAIAHRFAAATRTKASSIPRKMTPDKFALCCALFKRDRSVSSAMHDEQAPVCTTTLYAHLFRLSAAGSHMKPPRPRDEWMAKEPLSLLPRGFYRGRKAARHKRMAAMKDATPIAERADVKVLLLEGGHWEVDTVRWPNGEYSLTLREMTSGLTFSVKLTKFNAKTVAKLVIRLLRGLPVKSITSDGGSEFARWRLVCRALGVVWYVCAPHSPWQRGGVEQANGVIRGIVRSDMRAGMSLSAALSAAQRAMNGRKTKRLNWRAPAEVLAEISAM